MGSACPTRPRILPRSPSMARMSSVRRTDKPAACSAPWSRTRFGEVHAASTVIAPRPTEVRALPVAVDRRGGIVSRVRSRASDEQLIAALAAILSIGFFVWYDAHGLTSAFNDARIREIIARRVVVSR